MVGIQRPKTMEAYKELVKQAVFDVEELRMSIEYDMEYMEDALAFYNITLFSSEFVICGSYRQLNTRSSTKL